jgi:hypothetical protein
MISPEELFLLLQKWSAESTPVMVLFSHSGITLEFYGKIETVSREIVGIRDESKSLVAIDLTGAQAQFMGHEFQPPIVQAFNQGVPRDAIGLRTASGSAVALFAAA